MYELGRHAQTQTTVYREIPVAALSTPRESRQYAGHLRKHKKAWMTASVFQDWFSKTFVPAVRKYQRENNIARKAVLLLDNCPAHPPADTIKSADGSITSYYLPKNTTSMIQPLDQGIIANFKLKYRQDLVQGVIEDGSDIPSFLKKVTIKDAFYHAATAWDNVLPTTIYRCFNKGLGGQDNPTPAETEPTETSEDSDFNGFSTADIKNSSVKTSLLPHHHTMSPHAVRRMEPCWSAL